MAGVSKIYPPNKQVLKDIYLSFFYGAKIGVLGLNGAGKSSLLRIIAGIDTSYQGEVVFSPGYSVGFLEQEPQLDENKTVKEIVEKEGGRKNKRKRFTRRNSIRRRNVVNNDNKNGNVR